MMRNIVISHRHTVYPDGGVWRLFPQCCLGSVGLLLTCLTSLSVLPPLRPDSPRPGLTVPPGGHQTRIPLPPCWSLCPARQQPQPRGGFSLPSISIIFIIIVKFVSASFSACSHDSLANKQHTQHTLHRFALRSETNLTQTKMATVLFLPPRGRGSTDFLNWCICRTAY